MCSQRVVDIHERLRCAGYLCGSLSTHDEEMFTQTIDNVQSHMNSVYTEKTGTDEGNE